MAAKDEPYSLFQEDILERLARRDWFIKCIFQNYTVIAETHDCVVHVSGRRLGEAHDFWQADTSRALHEGSPMDMKELDHFKHAAFIAFWLRRLCPINETFINRSDANGRLRTHATPDQEHFLHYGNELAALVVGFRLCLFYEVMQREENATVRSLKKFTQDYLNKMALPQNLRDDFLMILKHKNMSPHAIYLAYRSMFLSPLGQG